MLDAEFWKTESLSSRPQGWMYHQNMSVKRLKSPEIAIGRTSHLALAKVAAASRKIAARKGIAIKPTLTLGVKFKINTPAAYKKFRDKAALDRPIQTVEIRTISNQVPFVRWKLGNPLASAISRTSPPIRAVPELSAEKHKLYSAFGGPSFSADVVVADFLERYDT